MSTHINILIWEAGVRKVKEGCWRKALMGWRESSVFGFIILAWSFLVLSYAEVLRGKVLFAY